MTNMMKRIRAVILNGCKQYKWLCIGWSLLLLCILPTRMLMFRTHGSLFSDQMIEYAKGLQSFENPLLITYLLLAPIVSVLIIFSHLHQKNRVDLVHHLPVTRLDLLIGRGLIAFFSVWIPLMTTGIVIYAMRGLTPEFQSILEWKFLLLWMIHGSVYLLLHTSITIFMGFLTGMIPTHGLFTVIAYLFPMGMYALTLVNMSLLLQTYNYTFDFSDRFSWWLPIIRISLRNGFSLLQDFVYLVVGLLFFLGAYLLYRIRNLEAAGNVIAFEKLNRIFKYGMGFSFMMVLGPFFYLLSNEISSWLYIGYGLGGLFGFLLAEVLIQKSFHILNRWKSFLVFIAASLVLIGCMRMDLFGVARWQPNAESIQEVSISNNNRYYYRGDDEIKQASTDAKEKTLALQKEMIAANRPEGTPDTEEIFCNYHLTNNGQTSRVYTLDEDFLNSTYLTYLSDPEIIMTNFPILSEDIGEIKSVNLSSSLAQGRVISLSNPQEIRALAKAIQTDISSLDGKDYWNYLPNDQRNAEFAYVHFLDQDGQTVLYMPLRKQFEKTVALLTIQKHMDRLVLTLDEVESMLLNDRKNNSAANIMIHDTETLEDLITFLNETGDRSWRETDYELIVYFKDRELSTLYYQIDKNELPLHLQE